MSKFGHQAREKILSQKYDNVCIELCCEGDSALSMHVGSRCLAIRVTRDVDGTSKETVKSLHFIIRLATHMKMRVHLWVSIPCTAGCTWKHVNDAVGVTTGDEEFTDRMVKIGIGLARHAATCGG